MNWKWLVVVLALAASPALACQFDVDCGVGQKCQKQFGQTEGSCTSDRKADDGGLSHDPTDPYKADAQSCDTDFDCGPMGKCLRTAGKVSGTCAGGGGGIHHPH